MGFCNSCFPHIFITVVGNEVWIFVWAYTDTCLSDHLLEDMGHRKTTRPKTQSCSSLLPVSSWLCGHVNIQKNQMPECRGHPYRTASQGQGSEDDRIEINLYLGRQELLMVCHSVLECSHYQTHELINLYCANTYYLVLQFLRDNRGK